MARTDASQQPNGQCTECLQGPIPSEIGLMSNLERLWLFENSLDMELPSELGLLSNLASFVAYANQLVGVIPEEYAGMTSLGFLDLSINFLGPSLTPALFEFPLLGKEFQYEPSMYTIVSVLRLLYCGSATHPSMKHIFPRSPCFCYFSLFLPTRQPISTSVSTSSTTRLSHRHGTFRHCKY